MDLQFAGESTLAIAQYVAGYVTKAEKSNMQELWQEVSSHNSVYTASCGCLVSAVCDRESVVSMRPAISSSGITCVESQRPSSGLMCPFHKTERGG